MTVTSALLSFSVVAVFLTIIPGLDTALVLRSAIAQSRRHAIVTALGINTGALVWGAAAAVGATALLAASTLADDGLRIAGALYMIYLGAMMLWRTRSRAAVPEAGRAPASEPLWRAFARGATTNLLNPKVGAFYLAVIPQFVPANSNHLLMGLALAMVHNLVSVFWFAGLIGSAHLARRWLSKDSVRGWIDRVTGVVLVGFGVKLAASRA
ncbi:LysE family translocator [Nakamurella silvestris]|nr:LysE family translocator [Nakamurella silvestris]